MATSIEKASEMAEVPADRVAVGVVVLGAGRSGTSAIARALVRGGFFAGEDDDLLGSRDSNPIGHYEPLSVLELDEELLEELGRSWWADAPTPEEQLSHRAEIVPRLRDALDALVASSGGAPIAIKEPRINSLLPLWQPVIEGVLHPVLAVRDPLAVAHSHSHRDGLSVIHALATWEVQTTAALRWLDGQVVTVAPYEQLIAEPRLAEKVVGDAATHIDPSRAVHVHPTDAKSALMPGLRRQDVSDFDHGEYLTERQARLCEYLGALPAGDAQIATPAELLRPNVMAQGVIRKEGERVQMLDANTRLAAETSDAGARIGALEQRFAEAIELSRQAVSAAEERAERGEERAEERAERAERAAAEAEKQRIREVAEIQRSASWRLTAPLRRIKRLLRRSAP